MSSTDEESLEEFGSPQDDDNDRDGHPRVFSSGSEISLSWDSSANGVSFNNSAIVDPYLVSDLQERGISVLGEINQRYRIRTSERTPSSVNSATSQDTVTMPTEVEKKKYRALIISAEMFVNDDLSLIADFKEVTLDYVKDCSNRALAVKSEIQTAQVFLFTHDQDDYEKNFRD